VPINRKVTYNKVIPGVLFFMSNILCIALTHKRYGAPDFKTDNYQKFCESCATYFPLESNVYTL